jgi:hypothetical protein
VHPFLLIQELQAIKFKHHNSNYINQTELKELLYDDCHKQAVLISESYGDSNRYRPYREKLNQHTTCFPCSFHVWSWTIHLMWSMQATLRRSPQGRNMPLQPKEVLVTKDRLTRLSPWVTSFFLPYDSLEVGERGFGQVVTQLHQLTGPINTSMRSVLSILACGGQPIGP